MRLPLLRLAEGPPGGRGRGLTLALALILGLGLCAGFAGFDMVEAIALRQLPVRSPSELVFLHWSSARHLPGAVVRNVESIAGESSFSLPTFRLLKRRATGVAKVFAFADAAVGPGQIWVRAGNRLASARGEVVTGGYFSDLGVRPLLGRLIGPGDERPNAEPVLVISHRFWRSFFGGAAAAVGSTVRVGDTAFVIAGVAPPGFFGVQPGLTPDFWEPIGTWPGMRNPMAAMNPHANWVDRNGRLFWWLTIMARVAGGASNGAAKAALARIFLDSLGSNADLYRVRFGLRTGAYGAGLMRAELSVSAEVFLIVAVLTLLAAGVNVGLLLAADAAARRRDTIVRLTLGGSPGRLACRTAAQIFVLVAIAGAPSFLAAVVVSRAAAALLTHVVASVGFSVPGPKLDWGTAGLGAAALLIAFICAAAVPVIGVFRLASAPALFNGSAPAWRGRPWFGLVAIQIAFSMVIVVGALLFVRTVWALERAPLGYDAAQSVTFKVDAIGAGMEGNSLARFYLQLTRRIQAIPGVLAASSSIRPLTADWSVSMPITVYSRGERGPNTIVVPVNLIGPEFFKAAGLSVGPGVGLGWSNLHGLPRPAFVNEAFARLYLGKSAVGSAFNFGRAAVRDQAFTILGVVSDAHYRGPALAPRPMVYVPYSRLAMMLDSMFDGMHFVVRSQLGISGLAGPIRSAVSGLSPGLPVQGLSTQRAQLVGLLAEQRLMAWLGGLLGAFLVLLAVASSFAVQSRAVSSRAPELAVRAALGAQPRDLRSLVWKGAASSAVVGIAAGWALSYGGARLVASLLYGIAPGSGWAYLCGAAVLVVAIALGSSSPARAAGGIRPTDLLRRE
jgi:macrolide transport system ATP-binding/permease protein